MQQHGEENSNLLQPSTSRTLSTVSLAMTSSDQVWSRRRSCRMICGNAPIKCSNIFGKLWPTVERLATNDPATSRGKTGFKNISSTQVQYLWKGIRSQDEHRCKYHKAGKQNLVSTSEIKNWFGLKKYSSSVNTTFVLIRPVKHWTRIKSKLQDLTLLESVRASDF